MLEAYEADPRRQRNPTRHNQTASSERHGPNWKVADIAADATGHPVERIPEDREQNKGQAMEIERTTFGSQVGSST